MGPEPLAMKKRKIAVIGAGYLQLPLVRKIREMGYSPLCFAWRDGAVAAAEADGFFPVSIREKEEILRLCREQRVSGVLTAASDAAVPTVAHVAAGMGLPGPDPATVRQWTHKFEMRRVLAAAGLPCPRFLLLRNAADDAHAVSALSFPMIVKPCDRSGSLGVRRVDTGAELFAAAAAAREAAFSGEAIAEEFVRGREVSVESISGGGRHYILAVTDKVTSGAPHFVELAHHQPSLLPEPWLRELRRGTAAALTALGLVSGAAHTEWLVGDDGTLTLTETGARMGGDFIGSHLVPLSCGYDYLRGIVECALGEFTPPEEGRTVRRCAGVWFLSAATPAVREYLTGEQRGEWIVERKILREPDPAALGSSADRTGYLIYASERRRNLPGTE